MVVGAYLEIGGQLGCLVPSPMMTKDAVSPSAESGTEHKNGILIILSQPGVGMSTKSCLEEKPSLPPSEASPGFLIIAGDG